MVFGEKSRLHNGMKFCGVPAWNKNPPAQPVDFLMRA
jgi:hypothetical protein